MEVEVYLLMANFLGSPTLTILIRKFFKLFGCFYRVSDYFTIAALKTLHNCFDIHYFFVWNIFQRQRDKTLL